jgi:hypothetical protein
MCICVYVYMCICVYVYMCICVYVYVYVYVYIFIYYYLYFLMCTCLLACVGVRVCCVLGVSERRRHIKLIL